MKFRKIAACVCALAMLSSAAVFTACGDSSQAKSIVSIDKTSSIGLTDYYTITYSDGTYYEFSITNGANGSNGKDGIDGKDGADGTRSIASISKTSTSGLIDTYTIAYTDGTQSTFNITNGKDGEVDADELYRIFIRENPALSFEDFMSAVAAENNCKQAVTKALASSLKVCCEFTELRSTGGFRPTAYYAKNIYYGSAVLFSFSGEYAYAITNYHVVYDTASVEDTKLSNNIHCYIYGSEDNPSSTSETDSLGCAVYDYGASAISCEYVGGCASADIAVIRMNLSELMDINAYAEPVEFAQEYYVGQTAIAVGNTENKGISVTRGVVSVDNEYVNLRVDENTRVHRLMRIDTAIYEGNSGGGLFDTYGKIIGITNSGDGDNQNMNYAIPVQIARSVAENIVYYSDGAAKTIVYGVNISEKNTHYEYDAESGYGRIVEDVCISGVVEGSPAQQSGLQVGDIIKYFEIDGVTYPVFRHFDIGDLLPNVRKNSTVAVGYERGGVQTKTSEYVVKATDLITLS